MNLPPIVFFCSCWLVDGLGTLDLIYMIPNILALSVCTTSPVTYHDINYNLNQWVRQERRSSIANALELRLSCSNSSTYHTHNTYNAVYPIQCAPGSNVPCFVLANITFFRLAMGFIYAYEMIALLVPVKQTWVRRVNPSLKSFENANKGITKQSTTKCVHFLWNKRYVL